MNSKRLLSVAIFILLEFGLIQVYSQNAITFRFVGGMENTTVLNTLSKITFSDDHLIMNYSNGNSESFDLSSLQTLVFSINAGIYDAQAEKSELYVYPNPVVDYLTLVNAPDKNLDIKIYRIDGVPVLSVKLSSTSRDVNVSFLPKGFYLLKVNNRTIKFTK